MKPRRPVALAVASIAGAAALLLPGAARPWSPPTTASFADVASSSPFYSSAEAAYAVGAMPGYNCGGPGEPCDTSNRPYFRPYSNITRGQVAKVLAIAGNLPVPSWATQPFADVSASSPFFTSVEAAHAAGSMAGYNCGGPGEPCDALARPYFRLFAYVTRSQIAKFVAVAAHLDISGPPATPSFADVPTSHPFFSWVEAVRGAGIMSGYTCGGLGEPCDALNRPYFRPYADVTRGQVAQIAWVAFFLADQTAPSLAVPGAIVVDATARTAPRSHTR